jgi:hypothetical protein
MTYLLGGVTLPNPKSFTRKFLETGAENLIIEGKTTKRVENRKEQFTLNYTNLTVAEVNNILSEYELNSVRDFSVTETNLSISSTPVLIDVMDREYVPAGESYRENLTLVLTEVI